MRLFTFICFVLLQNVSAKDCGQVISKLGSLATTVETVGVDSKSVYQMNVVSGEFRNELQLSFKFLSQGQEVTPEAKVFFLGEEGSVQFQLERDSHLNPIDRNLYGRVFASLYDLSESRDRFRFVLDDPLLIDFMNKQLNLDLKSMNAERVLLRPRPDSMLRYETTSYFVSLNQSEAEVMIETLKEMGALERARKVFLASDLGESIWRSGKWNITVDVKLQEIAPFEGDELEPFEREEEGRTHVALQYVIRLQKK